MGQVAPSRWPTDPEAVRDTDVLVVDDDEAVRSSVAEILRGEGVSVSEAVDGLEALYRLKSSRVRVMVLDVNMPRLSGLELLASLDDPPLVVLLTSGNYDDKVLAQAPKIAWFLKKPASPRELVTVVARCLSAIPGLPSAAL
jgi:DNA-binding response OmpR family regulator